MVSPGFGAGFSTWGAPIEAIFNPTLIELVEQEKVQEAIDFVEKTWEDVYSGGVQDLIAPKPQNPTNMNLDLKDLNYKLIFFNQNNQIFSNLLLSQRSIFVKFNLKSKNR